MQANYEYRSCNSFKIIGHAQSEHVKIVRFELIFPHFDEIYPKCDSIYRKHDPTMPHTGHYWIWQTQEWQTLQQYKLNQPRGQDLKWDHMTSMTVFVPNVTISLQNMFVPQNYCIGPQHINIFAQHNHIGYSINNFSKTNSPRAFY